MIWNLEHQTKTFNDYIAINSTTGTNPKVGHKRACKITIKFLKLYICQALVLLRNLKINTSK